MKKLLLGLTFLAASYSFADTAILSGDYSLVDNGYFGDGVTICPNQISIKLSNSGDHKKLTMSGSPGVFNIDSTIKGHSISNRKAEIDYTFMEHLAASRSEKSIKAIKSDDADLVIKYSQFLTNSSTCLYKKF